MKKVIALALAALMLLGLSACTVSGGKKVILGTSADYPPFEFHIMKDGKDTIVGFEVAIARQIAQDMGSELEIADMSFDNLLTLMAQGNCDFVIAAMEVTEDRLKNADYSDPYYTDLPPMVLTKKENADQYKTLDDFNGKVVGAQTGTMKADIVTDDMTGAVPSLMTNVVDLISNLSYDKCDALVLDGAVAVQYAESNPELVIADVSLGDPLPYCVWVPKGDPKGLLPQINKSIADMLAQGKIDTFIEEADSLADQALE